MVLLTRYVTQKLCWSAGSYINLCTIHFYDLFANYQNLAKNIASGKENGSGEPYVQSFGQKFKTNLGKTWRKSFHYRVRAFDIK